MTQKTKETFKLPIRVYYEDTDAGGIVYYANYLKFMERARTEWLRSLGFEQDQLREGWNIIFVVRKVIIEYLLPALFNDQLTVSVEISSLGKTHIGCLQKIYKTTEGKDKLITEASVDLVCVDDKSLRPRRLPETLRKAFSSANIQ